MSAPTPPWAPLSDAARAIMLTVLMRGPLPRSELARRIGLSAGSLTRLTGPLLDSGLLMEAGTSRGTRTGRPTLHREEHFGDIGRARVRIASLEVALAMMLERLNGTA